MRMLLQLFATNTTESKLAGNDLSAEMKTYYEKRLIDLAEPKLVHDQFGDKYPIPAGNGRTIEFRKYDSLAKATTPIVEGVTPTGNDLNVSSVQETVMQYGDWIQMSDLLEMSAVDNNVLQATRLLGAQAGRTLDSITRDVLAGGTNVIYAPSHANGTTTVVTSRSAIDESCRLDGDLIFRAAAQLKGMNAEPIDEAYVAIIHPYVAYDLMRSQEWIDAHKYASPENLYAGEIGKLAGVRFVESTEAKIFHAEDLADDSRTLLANGAVNGKTTVAFDGGTVRPGALVGRQVLIGSACVTVRENTASSMTVDTPVTVEDNAILYPGEAGAQGRDVYVTLVLGADGYGTTEITGGGLEHIVKQLGSAGTGDPLNQRASVGWKATKVAVRLDDSAIRRIETCSTYTE